MRINIFPVLMFFVFSVFAGSVNAQEGTPPSNAVSPPDAAVQPHQPEPAATLVKKEDYIENYPSLFFTYWQYQAIADAKTSRGHVRPPTEEELNALNKGEENDVKPDAGIRELNLGGIVYKGDNNWAIWLNSQRITPEALPKEVLDLQVYKDYIEVKWHDEFTGRIFPVRLRAHERFNLDMRIFLPG